MTRREIGRKSSRLGIDQVQVVEQPVGSFFPLLSRISTRIRKGGID
jgi:hypothetical protein